MATNHEVGSSILSGCKSFGRLPGLFCFVLLAFLTTPALHSAVPFQLLPGPVTVTAELLSSPEEVASGVVEYRFQVRSGGILYCFKGDVLLPESGGDPDLALKDWMSKESLKQPGLLLVPG